MTVRPSPRLVALILLAALAILPATGAAQLTSVTITNSAPVVAEVTLPSTTVQPLAAAARTVNATLVISDLNGCNDVSRVTAEVLTPGGATHVAASNATYVSCAAGTSATYRWSFTMRFHDAPAPLSTGYRLRVNATDLAGASGTNFASPLVFEYAELAALQLNRTAFEFGSSLAPGTTSSVLGLGVQNVGNVRLDAEVSGTDLAHASESASIGVGNLRYATASDMSGSAPLATSASTIGAFDLATGASSTGALHWRLTVPDGSAQWVPSGTYAGAVTIAGVKG